MQIMSRFVLVTVFCIIISLGLLSFVACMVAGVSREKGSIRAFRYGIVSVLCLSAAQIIGNLLIFQIAFSRTRRKCCGDKKTAASTCFLVVSWVSFVIAIILLSAATSMSRRQSYGRGWLDGECYLVKDEVYMGSGVLILLTIVLTIGSAVILLRTSSNQPSHHNQRKIQQQNMD